jgi:hypothetical protein
MNNQTSVPTLNIDFTWKPNDHEYDLLLQTILPVRHPFEIEATREGNPLFRRLDVTVPIKLHVVRKLQVFADHFELSLGELVSRLLDMEVTQYGQFDMQHRLRLVDVDTTTASGYH